jgi:hypothetical protein
MVKPLPHDRGFITNQVEADAARASIDTTKAPSQPRGDTRPTATATVTSTPGESRCLAGRSAPCAREGFGQARRPRSKAKLRPYAISDLPAGWRP